MRWLSLIIGASAVRCAPFDSRRATRAISAANARCDCRLAATFASGAASAGSREKHAAESAAAPPASSDASAAWMSDVDWRSSASAIDRMQAPYSSRSNDFRRSITLSASAIDARSAGLRGAIARRAPASFASPDGRRLSAASSSASKRTARRLVEDLRARQRRCPVLTRRQRDLHLPRLRSHAIGFSSLSRVRPENDHRTRLNGHGEAAKRF